MMPPSACPVWPTDSPGPTAGERNEATGSYTTAGDKILQERLACLGIGGCFASESPAGFNRNARLLCVETRISSTARTSQNPACARKPMAAHRKFQMTASFVFSRSETTRYDRGFAVAALMTWVASSKLLILLASRRGFEPLLVP
jgi:hypothetical protein